MPRTLDEAFRDFLSNLTPSTTESEAAKSHRASIETRLKNSFNMRRFFRMGSFGNGTSISGYSDVDYFASLPTDQLSQNSDYSLKKVRDDLDSRFPYSGVRTNCPAVLVPFGTKRSEDTEVVPADYIKSENGNYIYDIPDCNGGWMRSSPDAHNEYVRKIDQSFNGKLKPLIRYVKAWKYYNNVPVASFYLEMRIAKYASTEKNIVYRLDLAYIFRWLWWNDFAALQDPTGISGYINACKTKTQLEESISKALTAKTRAEKANEEFDKGNLKDAFDWWNLLYAYNFPSYYR
jgi:hypothetical protein